MLEKLQSTFRVLLNQNTYSFTHNTNTYYMARLEHSSKFEANNVSSIKKNKFKKQKKNMKWKNINKIEQSHKIINS